MIYKCDGISIGASLLMDYILKYHIDGAVSHMWVTANVVPKLLLSSSVV